MSKICKTCRQQWPTDFSVCPICGGELMELNKIHSSFSMGDGNAINGGIQTTSDSHDRTTNITHITQVEKSEAEKLKENKQSYRLRCKELYSDGKLSQEGLCELRELQVSLNLADEIVNPINEECKRLSKNRKTVLSYASLNDIKQTKSIIEQHQSQALQRQLDKLTTYMTEFDNDSLKQVYYQLSAILEPAKYVNRFEDSSREEYWETYWAFIAALLQHNDTLSNEALALIGQWRNTYPEQNERLLYLVGVVMQADISIEKTRELRTNIHGSYTSDLKLLLDTIDELLTLDWSKEDVVFSPRHAFYLDNLFPKFIATQKERGRHIREEKRIQEESNKQRLLQEEQERKLAAAAAQAIAIKEAEAEAERQAEQTARAQEEAAKAETRRLEAETNRIKEEQERLANILQIEKQKKQAEEDSLRQQKLLERKRKRKKACKIIIGIVCLVFLTAAIIKFISTNISNREQQQALEQYCSSYIEKATSDELFYLEKASVCIQKMEETNMNEGKINAYKNQLRNKALNIRQKTYVLSSEDIQKIDNVLNKL